MSEIIFDNQAVNQAIDAMTQDISAPEVYIIGIHRGGAEVADTLQQRLKNQGMTVLRGNLDISFYRDDLDTIAPNPEVRSTDLPFDLSGKHLWLVDDVLYTGRTIRAALEAIFDYGRPASVRLAVLVDRGGRELPIKADCTGLIHNAPAGCSVKLVMGSAWHIEQKRVEQRQAG